MLRKYGRLEDGLYSGHAAEEHNQQPLVPVTVSSVIEDLQSILLVSCGRYYMLFNGQPIKLTLSCVSQPYVMSSTERYAAIPYVQWIF